MKKREESYCSPKDSLSQQKIQLREYCATAHGSLDQEQPVWGKEAS